MFTGMKLDDNVALIVSSVNDDQDSLNAGLQPEMCVDVENKDMCYQAVCRIRHNKEQQCVEIMLWENPNDMDFTRIICIPITGVE